jgi:DNA polymerase V
MCDLLTLDLAEKRLVTKQLTLTIGYDIENLTDKNVNYRGEITFDYLGRMIPKHAHGTVNLPKYSSSTRELVNAIDTLFLRIVSPKLTVRRINITASGIASENERTKKPICEQLDFFTDTEEKDMRETKYEKAYLREKEEQMAIINIRKKFGKNAILKGMNFEEGATTIDRNMQIGGHRA